MDYFFQKHICNTTKMLKRFFIFYFVFFFFCIGAVWGQTNERCADTLMKRLNGLQFAMSFSCNDLVVNYIKKITKENKKETQKALENFLPHQAFFEEELSKAGLPREFCYLPLMLQKIQQENGGTFYSAGVWNLPLLVAVKYGLTVDDEIDERYDLKKSTATAISYLLDIQSKEKKLWNIVIAYSNSLSALESAKIRTSNNDSIWNLYENGHLPNRNCIPYFIAYLYIANFYDAEHLKVDTTNAEEYKPLVRVKKEIDTVNRSVKPLEKEKTTTQTNTPTYHIVQSGDMLGRIAQKYEVTVEQLKAWNNLSSDIIQIEQRLIVSKNAAVATPAPAPTKTTPSSDNAKKLIYTVKQGDTLGGIARKYNVSVNNIKTWNNLKSDNIGINQKLVIYQK